MLRAVILTVQQSLEFNFTPVYRWAFLGEVVDAIERLGNWDVDVFDGAVLDARLDDYVRVFRCRYDLVLIYTDPHTSKEARKLAEFCKVISPGSKVMVYGRAAVFIPHYFQRPPFDAVHLSGDRELVIRDYAAHIAGQKPLGELAGIWMLGQEGQSERHLQAGPRLSNGKWFFPKTEKLPVETYRAIYRQKGRPLEYAISVSKGCPHRCKYCETSLDQGCVDRRRNIDEVLAWVNTHIQDSDDWTVQLWSSNFFEDEKWVLQFCESYRKTGSRFAWRAVGSFRDIDDDLTAAMSTAGCYEVAVGVESLFQDTRTTLKGSEQRLLRTIAACKAKRINIKCLLMAGLPRQKPEDLAYTIQVLRNAKVEFRFTLYTPLQELSKMTVDELDRVDLGRYDRRTFLHQNHRLEERLQIMALVGMYDEAIELARSAEMGCQATHSSERQ